MTILTMTATFGKLKKKTLTLQPGFNLIYAPNESGKSTWAAFLKAMFYGIDTRDRDRKGYLADKNRYQPWSGAPMEGEITLNYQGRSMTIRRGPKGSTPFGSFSAVYTGTQEPVPGLTGENCGEMLLGVGREVFERSAFLGQNGLAITSAPELERRIAALVSSGEEDVSFSQTQRQLKDWLNRRKVNKSVGRIPQLEEELSRVKAQRREAEELNGDLNRTAGECVRLSRLRRELEEELEIHRRLAQHQLNRRFAQAKEELEQAQQQLDTLHAEQARFGVLPGKERLKEAQGELAFLKALDGEIRQGEEALEQAQQDLERARANAESPYFSALTGEEAVRRGEEQVVQWNQRIQKSRSRRVAGGVLLVCGLLSMGAGAAIPLVAPQWLPNGLTSPIFWGPLAAGGVLSLGWLVCLVQSKSLRKAAQRLLDQYDAQQPEDITRLAQDYQQRMVEADQAAQQVVMVRGGLEDRKARKENSRNGLFSFVHSFAPEVKDLFGCSAALSRALNLGEREAVVRARYEGARRLHDTLRDQGGQEFDTLEQLTPPERTIEETAAQLGSIQAHLEQVERAMHLAQGRQETTGDPAVLAACQEQLEEELARRRQEFQAITIAMEALEEANAQMQEQFSPALNQRAGKLLDRLTGGAYREVSLNRELEAAVTTGESILPHRALFLSKGTVDQIYLALRLAVYDLCLGGKGAPLVLDDALAAFDDQRMEYALELLLERAGEEQILFFTCQRREGELLTGRSGVSFPTLN